MTRIFLNHLTGDQATDWKDFLTQAALGVGGLREHPECAAAEAAVEAMIDALNLKDARLANSITEGARKVGYRNFEWGVLVGAALTRCWPDGPEGIGEWAARAEDLLDFHDGGDDSQSPAA